MAKATKTDSCISSVFITKDREMAIPIFLYGSRKTIMLTVVVQHKFEGRVPIVVGILIFCGMMYVGN